MGWWCLYPHVPPVERAEVTEETKLVELCAGRHDGLKGAFTLPSGASMVVSDLKGFTKEELMAEVERQKGPRMLVPAWLVEHGLKGYLTPTKKAKTGSDSGSSATPGWFPPLFSSAFTSKDPR